MLDLFFIAQAAGKTAPNSQLMSQIQLMAMLVLGLVAYWLLFLRPHNKKRKEMQDKMSKLTKGDKVVTIGGIHGKVSSVKDNLVVLKIDDKTEITFDKTAIATVVNQKAQSEKESADSDTKQKMEIEDEKK
ncbi:MAG: preprotein translocase subunit YajC [Spirochaetes bacterium GWF1_31_7]|nr:MAG: preprotein translocase subunit YajC [Spirochaetes bacterium GWE1_32_154]OHD49067.1 MAG: preprotein translocase subunit YajC [Spirochaetes bacterium GWF1_31_7]OHD50348.1 MAG: preprotein translocase subunit YajC [Spirochaetes bacterium GWE2_31_10]OHD79983.1 MAG: preprotein translocase subunit YajC [Spirochaetes bacterium RIFOXYB1_FULL_32_8]